MINWLINRGPRNLTPAEVEADYIDKSQATAA
jgi:hypothetical protein